MITGIFKLTDTKLESSEDFPSTREKDLQNQLLWSYLHWSHKNVVYNIYADNLNVVIPTRKKYYFLYVPTFFMKCAKNHKID